MYSTIQEAWGDNLLEKYANNFDNIIKPSETRKVIVDSFKDLVNKGELGDKHGNIPL